MLTPADAPTSWRPRRPRPVLLGRVHVDGLADDGDRNHPAKDRGGHHDRRVDRLRGGQAEARQRQVDRRQQRGDQADGVDRRQVHRRALDGGRQRLAGRRASDAASPSRIACGSVGPSETTAATSPRSAPRFGTALGVTTSTTVPSVLSVANARSSTQPSPGLEVAAARAEAGADAPGLGVGATRGERLGLDVDRRRVDAALQQRVAAVEHDAEGERRAGTGRAPVDASRASVSSCGRVVRLDLEDAARVAAWSASRAAGTSAKVWLLTRLRATAPATTMSPLAPAMASEVSSWRRGREDADVGLAAVRVAGGEGAADDRRRA